MSALWPSVEKHCDCNQPAIGEQEDRGLWDISEPTAIYISTGKNLGQMPKRQGLAGRKCYQRVFNEPLGCAACSWVRSMRTCSLCLQFNPAEHPQGSRHWRRLVYTDTPSSARGW